jgi:tripartite-type tricarboxylate transporter receptor subunit TctC
MIHSSFIIYHSSLILVCAALTTALPHASAQHYPARPIRVIVPSAAGGGGDIVARAVGQKLAESWGQQVVVDNRNGILGPEIAAKADADGHTLMLTTSALIVREAVYRKLPFETMRDFAAVTQLVTQSNVLSVTPSLPAQSVKELIAYAKTRPGQLNYASGGNGTSNHLAGELFKYMAGVDIVHVPYKGVPQGLLDVIGGRMHMSFTSPVAAMAPARDGKLRMLAVTTARRFAGLPNVPTLAEAGLPGYEFTGWMGVFAPARTPKPIVSQLHAELVRIVKLPEVKDRLSSDGAEPVGSSPQEFSAYVDAELKKWKNVVIKAGIRAD